MITRIDTNVETAIALLKKDEVVAIPTETVYGLAGNALNPETVLKIYEVKQRPSFDPLIVHTNSLTKISTFVKNIPDIIFKLSEEFSPGPLTYVLPKSDLITDIVSSGLPSVAIRIPDHPLTLELLSSLSFPLAAPSANLFGKISPTKAEHVYNQLQGKIPFILDGGNCKIGIESTIVSFHNNKLQVLRLGGITIDQLYDTVGSRNVVFHQAEQINAPGQLKSHYATQTPMLIGDIEELILKYSDKKLAVLSFEKEYSQIKNQVVLSKKGDLKEAAQKLFQAMHHLDSLHADIILTEVFPKTGLGLAINDRLTRAAYR
ncbi:MAG: threonylcarbamoyl-AMP synthase [Bacteroidetes bacterium]|nr:threonylcarbamoyl-AMP synthase [Bacteroidota bacterium]